MQQLAAHASRPPMTFRHDTQGFSTTCHGDDFLAEGSTAALDHLDCVRGDAFDVKVLPRIGPPGFGGQAAEGIHLGRTIAWTSRGFTWCGNPQHVADFITLMGLTSESRGSSTPASKATGKNMRNAMDELPDDLLRRSAGTTLFITNGRRSVQFALYEIMSGISTPTVKHWAKLHLSAQYMLQHPEERWDHVYQRTPETQEVLMDADWTADTEAWKSVSCTIQRLGGHLPDRSDAKQTVVALSSGESEFYRIVRTAAFGIKTR